MDININVSIVTNFDNNIYIINILVNNMQLINGNIIVDKEIVAFSNAAVYIRFEDITLQDASSQIIS